MTIEKNIPIPPSNHTRSKYPFADMEVGDSFLVEWDKIRNKDRFQSYLAGSSYMWRKRHDRNDWKFTTRATESGVRVWRVK